MDTTYTKQALEQMTFAQLLAIAGALRARNILTTWGTRICLGDVSKRALVEQLEDLPIA